MPERTIKLSQDEAVTLDFLYDQLAAAEKTTEKARAEAAAAATAVAVARPTPGLRGRVYARVFHARLSRERREAFELAGRLNREAMDARRCQQRAKEAFGAGLRVVLAGHRLEKLPEVWRLTLREKAGAALLDVPEFVYEVPGPVVGPPSNGNRPALFREGKNRQKS